jgi:hypothetical protein
MRWCMPLFQASKVYGLELAASEQCGKSFNLQVQVCPRHGH